MIHAVLIRGVKGSIRGSHSSASPSHGGVQCHKHNGDEDFTEQQYRHIRHMFDLTNEALAQMNALIADPHTTDVNVTFNLENEINNFRDQLKNQNITDINNRYYDYQTSVYYMDIINECEKLGDYVVNVVEARTNTKERKE